MLGTLHTWICLSLERRSHIECWREKEEKNQRQVTGKMLPVGPGLADPSESLEMGADLPAVLDVA